MSGRSARAGILAVWNGRNDAIAALYEDWYVNQHLPERVGLPGWQAGRRYEAVEDSTPYFTYYRLESAAAAFSEAYLARLNAPTPETVTVMSNWSDMTRTCCELVLEYGETRGAYCVVARFYATPDAASLEAVARRLWSASERTDALRRAWPLAVQLWRASSADAPETSERNVRAEPDREVKAALVADAMREHEAREVAQALREALHEQQLQADNVDLYRYLCERQIPPA